MPCNLAVSITKAAVTEEHLLALLTPAVVQPVVVAYLRQPGVLTAGERVGVTTPGARVVVTVGALTFHIDGGRVSTVATAGATDARGRALVDALSALLALAADTLFAQQVRVALAAFGRVSQQSVTVDNGGVPQAATVLTLTL
jgi:hypothetical protein